ncbi:Inner membrane protein YjdF [Acinetobacter stercoris]|uniref:Inner membrane protein YjdF n=2 Tax=Acinetobacter stercoris TaxID=2126983 RepID=A0A2U3N192_9GAMM|nr:Inner membrane protein YjdF [Acinetobacter stercoris]
MAKHYLVLGFLFLEIMIASINPLEMPSYLLHQLGTALMLCFLFFCQKKIGLTFNTFLFYILFLCIHVIAAHYLYSYVPYNEWIKSVFHFDLNQIMGWSRNMFDRLVHLFYGLFLFPFFFRLFQVWIPNVKTSILMLLVIQFVMATSLFYEWIEWWIAIGLSPEEAEKYNGQQGDIWDAHKDMLLATIGAIISACIILLNSKKELSKI